MDNIILENLNSIVFIINMLSIAGAIFTATMIHYAYKKFQKCELSNVIKWVAISVAFIVTNRVLEIFNDYLTTHEYLVFFIAKLFLLGAIASMIYTSLLILNLTKMPQSELPEE